MKVVVIGASPNPERVSFTAVEKLSQNKHEVIPLGIKKGKIGNYAIITERIKIAQVDTVTLYINPEIQKGWYDYILNLKPRRVIFNPGAENREFKTILEKNDIQTIENCTLVMLSLGQF